MGSVSNAYDKAKAETHTGLPYDGCIKPDASWRDITYAEVGTFERDTWYTPSEPTKPSTTSRR